MNLFYIINPEKKVYPILAADKFEAIQKAKKYDTYKYNEHEYTVLAKRKNYAK
jgi:adenylyl- and sulfurtransferase ThiI